jgi:L-threonylcarbamoyladenylate synthase
MRTRYRKTAPRMSTKVMTTSELVVMMIDPEAPSPECLLAAEKALREGELVVAPTETRYGLLARVDRPRSIAAVYALKKRSPDNPIAVFVSSLAETERFASVSPEARRLAERFLPGPLTLVLPYRGKGLDGIARKGKIGVRLSSSKVIGQLLARLPFFLTATSANLSGQSEPSSVSAITAVFSGDVRLYLDGGLLTGAPSAVVDASGAEPVLIRRGAVSEDEIRAAWQGK